MTELQSMPMFWSVFFADTEHLTEEAAKAHLFLIGHAWLRHARLPNDDGVLARLCRVGPRKWSAMKANVLELWQKDEDGFWTQRRMLEEYDFVLRRVEANRKNGALGGRPKFDKKINENNETQNPDGLSGISQKNPSTDTDIDSKKEKPTVSCPKRVRTRKEYPELFEAFWTQYPKDALMSKAEAGKAWEKLDEREARTVLASVPAFCAFCRSKPDYRPVHAVRYITQRRFEGFAAIETRSAGQILVKMDTPQWDAWSAFEKARTGKSVPYSPKHDGWFFPTEWPPDGQERHINGR